ncbi:response regulator [Natronogracilivirga saccharolytica]|uniref:Response regulator n=1 Tax=Natronogracilivirga saccharolytica TaxID=2812953 RepID=A0A8J7RKQ0_9BACT|nr:response regulator [Natronogracilivirga saccharolytica]MBP3191928.1 response regulator [Natronogracilivirga saccharolytica]
MSLNILVVDDSAVMRKMIIKTLNMSGIPLGNIMEASDGKEGLQKLEENWIDLLMIDINMPVMDGMEMLNHVRSNPRTKDTPVLIVSTESNEQRIANFYKLGASFVHKPFTPEELRQEISRMTDIPA